MQNPSVVGVIPWQRCIASAGPAVIPSELCCSNTARVPYLAHTGYELLHVLGGRKKLARMGEAYPPMTFPGEAAIDRRVEARIPPRVAVFVPFETPRRGWLGRRTLYDTPKGEEWRIPAMKLIRSTLGKARG